MNTWEKITHSKFSPWHHLLLMQISLEFQDGVTFATTKMGKEIWISSSAPSARFASIGSAIWFIPRKMSRKTLSVMLARKWFLNSVNFLVDCVAERRKLLHYFFAHQCFLMNHGTVLILGRIFFNILQGDRADTSSCRFTHELPVLWNWTKRTTCWMCLV